MILCLADDLTGLTELATQAADSGIHGDLLTSPEAVLHHSMKRSEKGNKRILFGNLACRSLAGTEAKSQMTQLLAEGFSEHIDKLFLKVDSVGRGPIGYLLEGIFEVLHPDRVPILLGNPHQNRIVREGVLYIDGVPLHETAFSKDPLHPTTESFLPHLLKRGNKLDTRTCNTSNSESCPADVCCLDFCTSEEVLGHAHHWKDSRVAVGAAPFGLALLKEWVGPPVQRDEPSWIPPPFRKTLAVVGTRHPAGDLLAERFRVLGGGIWFSDRQDSRPELPLLIKSPPSPSDPHQVLHEMGEQARDLIKRLKPETLIVFGGETAQFLASLLGTRVLRPLGYHDKVACLEVVARGGEEFLGNFFMSPGSYGEPDLWKRLFR